MDNIAFQGKDVSLGDIVKHGSTEWCLYNGDGDPADLVTIPSSAGTLALCKIMVYASGPFIGRVNQVIPIKRGELLVVN